MAKSPEHLQSEFATQISILSSSNETAKQRHSPTLPLAATVAQDKTETVEAKFARLMSEYKAKKREWIPDWKNRSGYEHLETAPEEQLAWEFLRRNRYYQKECDEWSFENEDGLADARKWGLSPTKHYSSEYTKSAPQGIPKWIAPRPHKIASTCADLAPNIHRTNQIELEDEQVAVVFDLSKKSEWLNVDLLAAQIEFLESILREAIENRPSNQAYLVRTRPQKAKLIEYLRVADALSCSQKVSRKDIGKQFAFEGRLFADKNGQEEISDADYSGAVSNHFEAAYRLIYEYGYLTRLVPKRK